MTFLLKEDVTFNLKNKYDNHRIKIYLIFAIVTIIVNKRTYVQFIYILPIKKTRIIANCYSPPFEIVKHTYIYY